MKAKNKMSHILSVMGEMFPDAHCELNHRNPFELTIAVLLSAQCTDETVNKVTVAYFRNIRHLKIIWQSPLRNLSRILDV